LLTFMREKQATVQAEIFPQVRNIGYLLVNRRQTYDRAKT